MHFKNPYLDRQVALMRLSDAEVVEVAQKYGLDLRRDRHLDCEEKLLEILEKYESTLELVQEFLTNPDKLSQLTFPLDSSTIEAICLVVEIERKESAYYDEILFDIPLHLPLSQAIERFNSNAKKVRQIMSDREH